MLGELSLVDSPSINAAIRDLKAQYNRLQTFNIVKFQYSGVKS